MPARAPARRARTRPRARARGIGLALAGGGPLGGIYEVGALLALADSLDGLDLNDLDVYVGVSSGGFVAAALANGISPAQMYRLFIDDGADAALTPRDLSPAGIRRVRAAPRRAARALAARATLQYLRDPFHRGVLESLATLVAGDADRRVRQPRDRRASSRACSSAPGRTNDFRKLARKLFLVATNLDTGASVMFGAHRARSRADLARDRGVERAARVCSRRSRSTASTTSTARSTRRCTRRSRSTKASTLLLCVNPLVPFDASAARNARGAAHRRQAQPGRPAARAVADVPRDHPLADEGRHGEVPRAVSGCRASCCSSPTARTRDMFFANIFSYWQRKRLCALAFAKTRRNLAGARGRAGAAVRAPRHRAAARPAGRFASRTSRTRSTIRARCARIRRDRPSAARRATWAHARPARALARRRRCDATAGSIA